MNLCNVGHGFNYETEKLCRIFLPYEKINVLDHIEAADTYVVTVLERSRDITYLSAELYLGGKNNVFIGEVRNDAEDYEKECERVLAIRLFRCFVQLTNYRPLWGILTGVRPAKLYSRLKSSHGEEFANLYFSEKLLVDGDKISLCSLCSEGEKMITAKSEPMSYSLYISIPFCPTRCSYCSFVSHSVDKAGKLIPEYIEKLCEEIKLNADIAKSVGLKLLSVYIGGGTPTSVTAQQLEKIMHAVKENYPIDDVIEYTVEAGRPDTITKEKLGVIKKYGATRISINPQSMNDDVLKAVGRPHTAADTEKAFFLARDTGFDNINMDLIAGLPTDTVSSFSYTVDRVISLNPDSVTVHSLSLKRAANMTESEHSMNNGNDASQMVNYARKKLESSGILPYYMYRQSRTVGNLENVGYAKIGKEGYYNVYIMDETHTILACGASAVTKLKAPFENNIERIFNYKYPYEYINGFDELKKRKERIVSFYDDYGERDK